MLEILLVVAISKKIAAMINAKGRSAAGYVILFVTLWFGGEIVGGLIGVSRQVAHHEPNNDFLRPVPANPNPNAGDDNFWAIYVMALAGAVIGGCIGYSIAALVPAIEQPHRPDLRGFGDDAEDDYERERRRRRREREAGADEGGFEEDRSGH